MITGQAQAAFISPEHFLADLMIADGGMETLPKLNTQLAQTFARALEGGLIGHADVGAIAGIVAVGHHQVRAVRFGQEPVQEMIVRERIAQPDVMAILVNQPTPQPVLDRRGKVTAPRLLRRPGVMNITDNGQVQKLVRESDEISNTNIRY